MHDFELLFCRVAVGRPCPVTEAADTNDPLSHGYNSYFVLPEGEEEYDMEGSRQRGGQRSAVPVHPCPMPHAGFSIAQSGFEIASKLLDDSRERGEYRFRFVVPSSAQVLPIAAVRFRARKRQEVPPPLCEVCEANVATVYCKQVRWTPGAPPMEGR